MYKYNKTQDSPYDPTELAIYSISHSEADPTSNCGHLSEKSVSVDDNLRFIVEKNKVTYVDFDCGITFYPEAATKIGREGKNISRSVEKTKVHPK